MKTVSIQDLRRKWREIESRLKVEKEILITRRSKPVAKLVHCGEPVKARKQFDPVAHAKWQKKINGGKIVRLVDKYLMADREDRLSLRKQK